MKINRDRLEDLTEAAAIEQWATRLSEQGFAVEKEKKLGELRADLFARRENKSVVYEVKRVGSPEKGWAQHASSLRQKARELGASFHLVLAQPPGDTTIEVEGLDQMLFSVMADRLPEHISTISSDTQFQKFTILLLKMCIYVRPGRIYPAKA